MDRQNGRHARRLSVGAAGSRVSSSSTSNSANRPQFYVNLEFGLSLSPGHMPNSSHTVSYQSRGLRERLAHVPHEPPAPTMPPSAARAIVPEPQAQRPAATTVQEVPRPSYSDHYYYQYQHNRGQTRRDARFDPPHQPQNHHHEHVRLQHRPTLPLVQGSDRSSRDSRSSSERGHSAPPHGSDSRWENAAAGASSGAAVRPQVWKPLPEVPGRFRLGEMELPWSTGPDADPDDERLRPSSRAESDDGHSILHPFRSREQAQPISASFSDNPTVLPLQAPHPPARVALEVDPRRRQELESLSAAMVTVDNGFEGQWWNQGGRDRLPVANVDVLPEQPLSAQRDRTVSLGWAVASSTSTSAQTAALPPGITRSASDNVVSPWSASLALATPLEISQPSRQMTVSPMTVADEDLPFPNSPASPWSRLNWTMSTRSEELFLTGSRYA